MLINKKICGLIFYFLLIGMLISGCKRNNDEKLTGSGIYPAQSGFKLLSYTNTYTGYLFTNNKNFFGYLQAELNQNVSWTFTIRGISSGAEKVIKGVSSKLDSTNNKWSGESTNSRFFQTERVAYYFKVDGIDTLLIHDTTATEVELYNYNNRIVNMIRTTVVDGMEQVVPDDDTSKFDNAYHDLDFREYPVFRSNKQFNNFAGFKEPSGEQSRSIHGNSCYYMSGIDYNYNTYVGGTNTLSLTALAGKIISTDPNSVYVNMYVYGFGAKNTALNIILFEYDSLNFNNSRLFELRNALNYYGPSAPNPNFVLNQFQNDVWQILVPVDWTGWKLVSLKYNQFRKHNTKGHLGNNVFEPNKLCGIAIELASSPNFVTTEVKAAFDYVTVTEGGPFSLVR